MIGSEVEFFVFQEPYDAAHANGYRHLTPNSPWLEDYNILQTTKEEDLIGRIRRGLRRAGPSSSPKVRPVAASTS